MRLWACLYGKGAISNDNIIIIIITQTLGDTFVKWVGYRTKVKIMCKIREKCSGNGRLKWKARPLSSALVFNLTITEDAEIMENDRKENNPDNIKAADSVQKF